MYSEEGGLSQRIKFKPEPVTTNNTSRSGFICCLLCVLLTLGLLIFVGICISRHGNDPFYGTNTKYSALHPDLGLVGVSQTTTTIN